MQFNTLSVVVLALATPFALFASQSTDHKIENAARASYNYRTVLADHVTIKAEDGVVTLMGNVEDKWESDLAVDTVENLPGVVRVENKLILKPSYPEYSDSWIAFKVRGRLLVKAHVSARTTTVSVESGVVTLTGSAENAAQKELTAAYTQDVAGVKSVVNNLAVVSQPATPGATLGETIDDISISTQVRFSLLDHKATHALKTKVTTNDGVVTLSGVASSEAEIALASKLAGDVRGVKSVTNTMTVKS